MTSTPSDHPRDLEVRLTFSPPPTDHPLWAAQQEVEDRMFNDGVDAFRWRVKRAEEKGRAEASAGYRRLMAGVLGPLSAAIAEFFEAAKAGRPGPKHTAVKLVGGMNPDALAYLTAKYVLSALSMRSEALVPVALALARGIEIEASIDRFIEHDAKHWSALDRRFKSMTSDVGHIRRAVSAIMADEGIETVRWTQGERVLVGTKLIELLIDATGLVDLEMVRRHRVGRPTQTATLSLSKEATAWVLDYTRKAESLSPTALPCVIPPRPWSGLKTGGYWTSSVRQWPFVKTTDRKLHTGLLRDAASLRDVMAAVNAVQETPWRINTRVLEVVRAIWDGGLDIPVLPPKDVPEIPEKPADIATNAEAKAAWKREAHGAWRLRAELMPKRRAVVECLRIADSFADREAIYFPHHLDFRGRLYALPRWLHPQGPDLAKGLLTFAEGLPLGTQEAVEWLAIHLANTWGEDKATFEERRAWVAEHEGDILATAEDPLANRWWAEADSPFCFLAACFEWAGYRREGLAFRSSLPVALDGSCNGLQHYSAMLRDPVGGAAVNLVPSDRPQDVYAEVAKAVMVRLEALASLPVAPPPEGEEEDPKARLRRERQPSWATAFLAFGVDRKITKRAVMVLPYGGTITSCRDYVRDAVLDRELSSGAKIPVPDEERNAAIGWLGSRVWEAIGDVVVAAREGMGWLQAASRVASKAELPLSWETPSGFVAFQKYVTRTERQVQTRIHGKILKPVVAEDTDDISGPRQASAIAPNFVHSLDAAALTLTVLRSKADGIGAFAMIHDSYATHAANTAALARHLREAFVSLYADHDPLADFRDRLLASLPEELRGEVPQLPERGSLDLSQVLQSPFFFA